MKFSGIMTQRNSLKLKVEIDENSGFCFGVVNAIQKAEDLLEQGETVYCVGDIVHNNKEVERLQDKGLITVDHENITRLQRANILFRAHGEPPSSYQKALINNNHIIDATCPIVIKLQRDIKKAYINGENIFIYGKPDHPEVIGLVAQTDGHAVVFESLQELKNIPLPDKLTLFSQTTRSLTKFYEIEEYLKEKGILVNKQDTICRQVANREDELKAFSKKHDKIIFVAGKNSSNGKILYQVCKKNNSASYFITDPRELKTSWFKEEDTVGVCGATSTPHWLLETVKEEIKNW
jgi:4-hydroxy-3-methylbut-2-enyl diphosphate reductase